ncbi:hypothetical protein DEJ17_06175 [Curtobacterium sp. MCSS17_011]|nr:hypothetical protein DEJ17_06175 [Curtobacterium sp. MCSS17_011]
MRSTADGCRESSGRTAEGRRSAASGLEKSCCITFGSHREAAVQVHRRLVVEWFSEDYRAAEPST